MIALYRRYLKRNSFLRSRAESIYAWDAEAPTWESRYLSSTLLSDAWQNWSEFCRQVIFLSCKGTVTRSGMVVVPRSTNNDRKRVAYEAKQASRGQSAKPGKVIQYLRQEPTWGNPDVLLTAIPVLSPANSDDLMSGFGLPVYAPKHIQTVRNACAHLNAETMADVRSLLVFYRGSGLSHPLDILWWQEPTVQSDAIFSWFEDLELVAKQVTR